MRFRTYDRSHVSPSRSLRAMASAAWSAATSRSPVEDLRARDAVQRDEGRERHLHQARQGRAPRRQRHRPRPSDRRTTGCGSERAATTPRSRRRRVLVRARALARASSSAAPARAAPRGGMQPPGARSPGPGPGPATSSTASRAGGRSPRPAGAMPERPEITADGDALRARPQDGATALLERRPDVRAIGAGPGEQCQLARVVVANLRGEVGDPCGVAVAEVRGRTGSPEPSRATARRHVEHPEPRPAQRVSRATSERSTSPASEPAGSSRPAGPRRRRPAAPRRARTRRRSRQPLPRASARDRSGAGSSSRSRFEVRWRSAPPVTGAELRACLRGRQRAPSSPSVPARTAPGSSASGIPSRRRHSSTICGPVPSSSRRGRSRRPAARVRGTARPHRTPLRARTPPSAASGRPSAARDDRLTADPEGADGSSRGSADPDRRGEAFPRAPADSSRTCSQLSRSAADAGPSGTRRACGADHFSASPYAPSAAPTASHDEPRVAHVRELDQARVPSRAATRLGRDARGQAALSDATGPVRADEPACPEDAPSSAISARRPTKDVQLDRQGMRGGRGHG